MNEWVWLCQHNFAYTTVAGWLPAVGFQRKGKMTMRKGCLHFPEAVSSVVPGLGARLPYSSPSWAAYWLWDPEQATSYLHASASSSVK